MTQRPSSQSRAPLPRTPKRAKISSTQKLCSSANPSHESNSVAMQFLQDAYAQYALLDFHAAEHDVDAFLELVDDADIQRVPALNLKAILAARTHRLELAVSLWQTLLQTQPAHMDALSNLGLALQTLNRFDEAQEILERVVALSPDHVNAHVNLGLLHQRGHRHERAIAHYQRALALSPGNVQAQFNVATLLLEQFRFDESHVEFQKAIAINPLHADAHANLIFTQHYRHPLDLATQLAYAKRFGALFSQSVENADPLNPQAKPLRIGWVSADLRVHPVGHFLRHVLRELKKQKVSTGEMEFIAYANGPWVDDLTRDLQGAFQAWHTVDTWNDHRLIAQIRRDNIDVLIDLSGHTAGNRLQVFAAKPAPVQISWLGYFATTGLTQMDAVLADPLCVPEDEAHWFVEKVYRLPHSRLCLSAPEDAPPVQPPAVERNGYITFGCYQTLPKINDGVLACWAKILTACPTAKLRLQTGLLGQAGHRQAFEARLTKIGLDSKRIELFGSVDRAMYLESYSHVDILLDSFPYPGGTTTAEAIWMGVPTITLAQPGMLGRQGQSMLCNVGLHDWVSHSETEYIEKAIAYGAASPECIASLRKVRRELRATAITSALFDAPRFARDFSNTISRIWHDACRAQNPHQLRAWIASS